MSNVSKRSSNTSFLKRAGKYLLFFALALVFSISTFAQIDPGTDPDYVPPDTPVPFDNGAYVLVVVAVAYGITQWYKVGRNSRKLKV